jgi:FkbM family methyltransferase
MNPRPADISAYLAQTTPIERDVVRLLAGCPRPTIFDIGACEGEDSIRYARRFPKGKVFTFEPLPGNQALIRANFDSYAVPNAELVPLALSDRRGEATFHVSSGRPPELFAGEDWNYGNKSSSLLTPATTGAMHGWIEFKEAITVKTETLDAFCLERDIKRIDFIHMDVQGAEQLVLTGAFSMLPLTTAVWLEVASRSLYRDQALEPEIARFMRSQGFILAHAIYLGDATGEGDHFYVNRRHLRSWLYLAGRQATRALNRIRRVFGGGARPQ